MKAVASKRPLGDRIAGTLRKKGVRGKVVENEPAKKIENTVRYALAQAFMKEGVSVAIDDNKKEKVSGITIESSGFNKKGDLLGKKKNFANNSYRATGEVRYFTRNMKTDTVGEKQASKFVLEFHDIVDRSGMPEVVVDKFELA